MRWPRSVLGAAVGAVLSSSVFLFAPVAAANADCPAPGRLACADLRGFDFTQEDLSGADLHGSNLAGVSLLQANLTGADLHGANLTDADLGQAELGGANLRGANLSGAWVGQANLTGADLREAVLTGTQLIQARMTGADLRGTDLRGANLTQAVLDDSVRLPDDHVDDQAAAGQRADEPLPLNPDPDPDADPGTAATGPAEDEPQVAFVLFWPAAALALAWWRVRLAFLTRHRAGTPVRLVDLVGGVVGTGLTVAGLHLAVVGAIRSFADGAGWAAGSGPLPWPGAEPGEQLVAAASAFVLGGILQRLARRRPHVRPPGLAGQVAVGKPAPGRVGPEFSGPVRRLALAAAVAGALDLVAVVVLLVMDRLPPTGPWQAGTVVGHLVFVALAVLVLFRTAAHARHGHEVAALSGAVFAAGVREPFLWLSGKAADNRPASQALPWDALHHVHLIRVLGTPHPSAAMITVRRPGAARPGEYPGELPVTPAQVAALQAVLPPTMITEHTRAPSSE